MRRIASVLLLLSSAGCFLRSATPSTPVAEAPLATPTEGEAAGDDVASKDSTPAKAPTEAVPPAAASSCPEPAPADAVAAAGEEESEEESEEGEDAEEGDEEEGESHDAQAGVEESGYRYTADLTDEALKELWKSAPQQLGSISVGFVDEGRLINGEQFPKGEDWIVVSPALTWATKETIEQVMTAIRKVKEQYPEAPPLRVNQMSAREGGYLRPHKSHQSGRDVDLGFYYPTAEPVRERAREKYIDVAKNWALVKALITHTDVQFILVDRHVIQVLYEHALAAGEDKGWLDSVFRSGKDALVKHARRHRDHFHMRFYNPRAQELGRRVAPLMAQRPDQNVVMHRVRSGNTLGHIAVRYGTSVKALQKANHLKGSFLRLGQVLRVPLRGPCTRCPVPPPVVVPERRLPPGSSGGAAG
jgi:murein endopeptidase